jgi:hypothetical protein
MEHGPISFPDWKQTLARADFEPARWGAFEREIIAFLRHCKADHSPVTVELDRPKPCLGVRSPLDSDTPGPGPGNA